MIGGQSCPVVVPDWVWINSSPSTDTIAVGIWPKVKATGSHRALNASCAQEEDSKGGELIYL